MTLASARSRIVCFWIADRAQFCWKRFPPPAPPTPVAVQLLLLHYITYALRMIIVIVQMSARLWRRATRELNGITYIVYQHIYCAHRRTIYRSDAHVAAGRHRHILGVRKCGSACWRASGRRRILCDFISVRACVGIPVRLRGAARTAPLIRICHYSHTHAHIMRYGRGALTSCV